MAMMLSIVYDDSTTGSRDKNKYWGIIYNRVLGSGYNIAIPFNLQNTISLHREAPELIGDWCYDKNHFVGRETVENLPWAVSDFVPLVYICDGLGEEDD